jgi:hypothetical protein
VNYCASLWAIGARGVIVRSIVAGLVLSLMSSGVLAAPPSYLTGVWSGAVRDGEQTTPLTVSIGEHTFEGGDPAHPSYAPATVTEKAGVVVIRSAAGGRIEGKVSSDGRSFSGKLVFDEPPELRDFLRLLGEKTPPPPSVTLTRTSTEQPNLPAFLVQLLGHWDGVLDMGTEKVRYTLDVGQEIRLTVPATGRAANGGVILEDDLVAFSFGPTPVFIGKLSPDGSKLSGQMGPGVVTFPIEFSRRPAGALP